MKQEIRALVVVAAAMTAACGGNPSGPSRLPENGGQGLAGGTLQLSAFSFTGHFDGTFHYQPSVVATAVGGDIRIERGNSVFYFPIVTCLIISILLTLLFSLFRR